MPERDAVEVDANPSRPAPSVNEIRRQQLDQRYSVVENGVEQLVLDEDGAIIEFR